jgi:drug/metabolite transporter (DMT)-like permease
MHVTGAYAGRRTGIGDWRTVAALAIVCLAWGTTYPAIRVMVETVPPLLGTGARFLVAGVLLYVLLLLRGGVARVRTTYRELAGAALIGTVILGDIGLLALAEQEVPAGLAALLIASVPLWIVVLRLMHRERVARGTLGAVAAGFGGVAILVLPGDRAGGAPLDWLLVLVLAGLIEALGQYYSKRTPLPPDGLVTTALQLLAAAIVLLLAGMVAGESSQLHLNGFSTESLAALAYLVGPGSLVAYSAFVWLLDHAPISTVSTYAYVNPVVAVLLGWAVLSEAITATIVAGSLAILLSVAFVLRREQPPARQPVDSSAEATALAPARSCSSRTTPG